MTSRSSPTARRSGSRRPRRIRTHGAGRGRRSGQEPFGPDPALASGGSSSRRARRRFSPAGRVSDRRTRPSCSARAFLIPVSMAQRVSVRRATLGSASIVRLHGRLRLLPHPRHRQEHRRAKLLRDLHHLARVRARGDGETPHCQRRIVSAPPITDVRGGQERDGAAPRRDRQDLLQGADLGHHVVVGEFDSLGWSRGAGGVDQGEEVVEADRSTRLPRSRSAGRRLASTSSRLRVPSGAPSTTMR